ncbi:conserved hypothetical protein [Candida dubliniensis CD36]|uniref:UEV domain-containing protein n=1 Tax=Candida dubliniensis (strain CD36 / ATCC MYA-646 / CBS 7987 / NCPF 3949 / NRRL Y-17841) TaxID=573826 RepID=B9W979_CANDC|nr:conserved hypothetical protein [Candida dubliniensis CD36]CAX45346.1 conserved hypothetical protein [Candida dubliniensis CD36]
MVSQQVSNWLFNVIQPSYEHKEEVYAHVFQFLQLHLKKNLNFKVRTQIYTSSGSGEPNLLINLFGTIQINEQIGVPVEIWIPFPYPYVDYANTGAPIVYIVPDHSKGWYLKPNNNVDTQGMFYHPYLTRWHRECLRSSPDSLSIFNLVELGNVIYQSVTTDCPITLQSPGVSSTPQKPAKVPLDFNSNSAEQPLSFHQANTDQSAGIPVQTTGPPLPAKPPKAQSDIQNSTPLKYQTPLPLPHDSGKFNYPEERTSSPLPPLGCINQQPRGSPTISSPVPRTITPPQPSPPVDLIDGENQLAETSTGNTNLSQELYSKINTFLGEEETTIKDVNEKTMKIKVLYEQLNHYYSSALKNSSFLDDIVSQLTSKVRDLTQLNQELSVVNDLNHQLQDSVAISSTKKISLDELVIADSPMIDTLYKVSAEINSIIDTINLISGNFHNEQEIVNEKNFDSCLKTTRKMGRELFWLHFIKSEIQNKLP